MRILTKKNVAKQNHNNFDKKINTRDKKDHCLFKYKQNDSLELEVEFEKIENLAMIRVWNYNVSRTDLYKGIKLLRLTFNKRLIFIGIIK